MKWTFEQKYHEKNKNTRMDEFGVDLKGWHWTRLQQKLKRPARKNLEWRKNKTLADFVPEKEGCESMELEIRDPLVLGDGVQKGKIFKIEYRDEPYRYCDIWIKEDTTGLELKYGVPTSSSINSKLVMLLSKFEKIATGTKVDPEKILMGRKVQFMTMTEETSKGGKFLRIVDNSVRPI